MKPTIQVQSASKRFFVHNERYQSFQDIFVNVWRRRPKAREFWALRDVSLTVSPGETVGIIGSNGSGKSTLLKLMSRIIEPTSGTIAINGKVSALLELGAGFHPELSGRDNVYLNWSLMGLSRKQADARFDEVVEFSELKDFIDMPVRSYSSGMYVRLAFAAAIMMDSEILIVDEVLAVGDVAFQEKCFSRIREIKGSGRSILLVSHALESTRELCDRVVWLDHGRVAYEGRPDSAISHYLDALREREEVSIAQVDGEIERQGIALHSAMSIEASHEYEITHIELFNEAGQEQHIFEPLEPLKAKISYLCHTRGNRALSATVTIRRDDGLEVHRTMSAAHRVGFTSTDGSGIVILRYAALALAPGHYSVDVALAPAGDPMRILASHTSMHHLVVRSPTFHDHGVAAMVCDWSGTVFETDTSRATADLTSLMTWAPSYALVADLPSRFLDGDWYPPEGDIARFRWIGRGASLYLMAPGLDARVTVTFSDAMLPYRSAPSRIRILIDDVVVNEFDAASEGLSTAVCRFWTPSANIVKVSLIVEHTIRPSDVGLGPDLRDLGVMVHEVWVEGDQAQHPQARAHSFSKTSS